MALLGAQLVITLVMISVIQKLGPHFSLARWILCSTGLIRYLYPTNTELREVANVPKEKIKSRKGGKQQNGRVEHKAETFHIPRNVDVELETAKVCSLDVIHLRFYPEYQWLVDFSLYAALVYIVTEVYQIWVPVKDEINLSMLWCLLVIIFSVKILLSLTVQYFRGEESVGERSTCICMGFTYLLISMMVLIVDESTLEVGLETAYTSFNKSAAVFLDRQGLSSTGPASKIVLKFFLALWCGLLGALFTFPGLRIARMHWDMLKYFRDRRVVQLVLNLSFALPFLLVISWIKPVSRNYLTVRVFSGMTEPLLTPEAFETLRIVAIVGTFVLKLCIMPWYLQAYLDMAYHRVEEQKKEAGRITNVDFQKKIAAVFYYLCVVTIQYLAPLIMCLYMGMMYKTLGEYSWRGLHTAPVAAPGDGECPLGAPPAPSADANAATATTTESIVQSAEHFHMALDSLKSVFTVDVFRGLFGFGTWWCCFLYFGTTSVGLIYQSYFSHS